MSRHDDINPMDINPETGRPYANYSSPSLDTEFHDGEMDVGESKDDLIRHLANMVHCDPEFQAEEAADILNDLIDRARALKGARP